MKPSTPRRIALAGASGLIGRELAARLAADPACSPPVIRALDDAAATLSPLGARSTLMPRPAYALYEALDQLGADGRVPTHVHRQSTDALHQFERGVPVLLRDDTSEHGPEQADVVA